MKCQFFDLKIFHLAQTGGNILLERTYLKEVNKLTLMKAFKGARC